MEGWSASWDCCFSLRCKFIFRQIRITSSDHLKQRIKNTQTFATFQVSTRYSHNWWHVTVCYLVGGSLISKVQEIYDNQAMWYQEWLFDMLIKVGNISRKLQKSSRTARSKLTLTLLTIRRKVTSSKGILYRSCCNCM
ncbi:hypothetical protein YC2023_090107 [Brassica napus]